MDHYEAKILYFFSWNPIHDDNMSGQFCFPSLRLPQKPRTRFFNTRLQQIKTHSLTYNNITHCPTTSPEENSVDSDKRQIIASINANATCS
jgi:hypothetical protein